MKNQEEPSKWVIDFLEWFCPESLLEGVLGDLYEQFDREVQHIGQARANRKFIWNTLRFFRPEIILRNKFTLKIINTTMFFNHFKIGFRNILRSKLYSFINAIGLSFAIAFCVLIYLFLQDEKSFDQWHTHLDKIYRVHVVNQLDEPDDEGKLESKSAYLQVGLAPTIKSEAPEVEYATRFSSGRDAIFTIGDKVFKESITMVDADFFKIFDVNPLYGNPTQYLKDQSQIVLTQTTAEKYFGHDDPVGKELQLEFANEINLFTVVGVITDAPKNSSLEYYDGLVRIEHRNNYQSNLDQWTSWSTPTFVKLKDKSLKAQFQNSLNDIHEKYLQSVLKKRYEEDNEVYENKSEYGITSLADVHLDNSVNWSRVSDPKYGLILSGIALLILIIACINYITLSLSSAAGKKLEVGIRKSVGCDRKHLIGQFMTESMMLAFIAMLVSVILVVLFIPFFNEFTNKSISLSAYYFELPSILIVFTILIGLIAGSYPALYLSGFKPIAMLKSRKTSKVSTSFTGPLVVIQFAISAFLIICSVVMFQQMKFITTKDLGYDKEQIVVIPTNTGWSEEGEKLVNRFKNVTNDNNKIIHVSGTGVSFNRGYSQYGYEINDKEHLSFVYRVDLDYIKTLNIKIKEGRDFDANRPTDFKNTLIVNEALVADMGWDDPLNEMLNWREDSIGGDKIIGVAENYHFLSLEKEIEPMFMFLDEEQGSITTMLVKISQDNIPETIDYLRDKWNIVADGKPFDYKFLDDDITKQYESYSKWSSIMGLTTLFAIFIACLGLFGLAGINAVNRTKEIGIRKALGAEMKDILVLMNKPFIIMAIISFVLAVPLSWWAMQQWLSDFKFAITLSWPLFVIALSAALFFAIATVSYHSLKASLVNPADTLKYE